MRFSCSDAGWAGTWVSRNITGSAGWLPTRAHGAREPNDAGGWCLRMRLHIPFAVPLTLAAAVLAMPAAPASAQLPGERIGQVTFPTSCAASVQKPFERAVALLHSFWYIEAAKAFTAVTQADPDCAIGYWGLALSQWTQIWAPPPAAALKRGVEA